MPQTAFPASAIVSGTMAQARLGSGSGGAGTKVLYDDQTYKTPSSGASPAGSGSELQYRASGTTLGAVTGSSFSGGYVSVDGRFGVGIAPSYELDILGAGQTYLRLRSAISGNTSCLYLGDKWFVQKNNGDNNFSIYSISAGTSLTLDYATNAATFSGALTAASLNLGGATLLDVLSATASLDFGNTATLTSTDLTITVTGATVGDSVLIGLPAAPDANTSFTGWVSAADTVTIRFNNYSAGSANPASGTYRATVARI